MSENKDNRKLRINMISSSIYQVFILIVPILTTPYVTRIFNVEQMGIYSLSLAIAALFVVIGQFGLPTFGSREIAVSKSKFEENEKFFYLESIQIFVSLIIFLIYNFLFLFVFDFGNKILFFSQSFLIIANIFDISWYYIGIEEIDKIIIRNGATKILTTAFIFLFIKSEDQLIDYALINVLGMFIGNLTMVLQSSKYINYKNSFFKLNFSIIKKSFLLFIPQFVENANNSIENSILSIKTTNANVGIYSESKKIVNLLIAIINSAFTALSPRMSSFVSSGEVKELRNFFNRGVLISNVFSIVVVVGINTVAFDFVDFFYGNGYGMVASVLQISSLGIVVMPIVILIGRGILIPYGKDKEYTNSILVILLSGILFNLLLVAHFGAIGAAISFCVSQFCSFVYTIIVSHKLLDIKNVILNIILTFFVIFIDIQIVQFISSFVSIRNSFISFLALGSISVITTSLTIFPLYFLNLKKILIEIRY